MTKRMISVLAVIAGLVAALGALKFHQIQVAIAQASSFQPPPEAVTTVVAKREAWPDTLQAIGSVAAVQSARVHLVLPEKSVFVSKNEPSSASVIVKLRGGRALGSAEVSSIVHLVSSSVAGLSPDRIAVVTTEGAVLHKPRRPGEEGLGDDERMSQARSLEGSLEDRARTTRDLANVLPIRRRRNHDGLGARIAHERQLLPVGRKRDR